MSSILPIDVKSFWLIGECENDAVKNCLAKIRGRNGYTLGKRESSKGIAREEGAQEIQCGVTLSGTYSRHTSTIEVMAIIRRQRWGREV